MVAPLLCRPSDDLCCCACCPPIRPEDYEHVDYRSSLSGEFSRNREDFLKGKMPEKPIVGHSCPGLGFLDKHGKLAGCLYHPSQNQGEDLRHVTGYQEKCSRESCPQTRAFELLSLSAQDHLVGLCQGMDSFAYSSQSLNPVRRLLGFGPQVAEAAAELRVELDELESWLWMREALPAWGHLLGCMIKEHGPEVLREADLTSRLADMVSSLRKAIMPLSPFGGGEPWLKHMDEWEARFWKSVTALDKVKPSSLAKWREALKSRLKSCTDS
jgi:hypothetical protein